MKKQLLISIIIVCLILLPNGSYFVAHETIQKDKTDQNRIIDPDWYKQPQIYDMAALPSDDIDTYHITVNGLWNGYIGENLSSPFALGRLLDSVFGGNIYNSDREFVEAQHNKGMIVPGTILTIQGHRSFQEDNFDAFASRSINGELCHWDKQADSYWMNILHPGYLNWCINHGKKAIDAGADMIVLDEIQGNSFIPIYQWSSQYTGIPAPGFSDETINGFRQYLLESYSNQELTDYFNINDISEYDLKTRIAHTMNLTYNERIQTDPLIKDYSFYLERSNFEAKKQLILALRDYAASKNKHIVISANSYALGTTQTFDFWSKGLIFADLLDLFTFENSYTAFMDKPIPDFYRTKWLAWERLAYAATNTPAVILIDTSTLEAINEHLFPLFGFSHSLGVLCAEAFANRGSFVNYYMPIFSKERNWRQVERIHEFVMDNKKYYDYSSEIYGDVGILFLYGEGMRTHMNTYLGCAQILAESHMPFDVIFDGEGSYLNTSLTLDDINDFTVLIIPSLMEVTDEQKNVVRDYVDHGGTAVIFDAESMGFDDLFGEVSFGNGTFYIFKEDVGKKYFETYDLSYLQMFTDTLKTYSDSKITVSNSERKIIATPYIQEENNRVILHLVNYDHIGFFDFLWPHSNIQIALTQPSFPVESVLIKYLDGSIKQLDFELNNDQVTFTVSYLKDYALVIIE